MSGTGHRVGLLRLAGAVLGGAIGAAAGFALPLLLARISPRSPLSYEWLTLLLAPGAHVVSWSTGWPLQQESALLCYGFSLVLTPLALGALVGSALGWTMAPHREPNRGAPT